ncbi:MAG: 5-(carboxyamino)imidazole ribonucleotide mutase [Gaiellaceae bacterium]|nr:5-(carboxyamino)imidazole ribonucleotide mutase [Gaiellaceae bacterium]
MADPLLDDDDRRPRVAIIYSSPGEHDIMAQVGALLSRFGVPYDEQSLSPHRAPRALADWMAELEPRGIEVVIAGSAGAAALAGIVAAHTTLPVIGVPLSTGGLDGRDALLGLTQLPPGVPVAAVGIDNAMNAAVLAVQVLAVADPALRSRLWRFKDDFEKAARH